MANLKIGVVGAGIVGLTTAEELIKQYPSAAITIMADKFNMETTSDGAAGLFMLVSKFKGPSEELTRKWVQDSYEYYMDLLHKDCGIFEIYGYTLSETTRDACWCPIMASVLPLYRYAAQEELLQFPGNWKYGSYSKSLITRGRTYLPWALKRLKRHPNLTVVKKYVNSLRELESEFDVIVNCSGLGAADICKDPFVIPIRGQVMKVEAPSVDKFYLAGRSYIIPSGHGVATLGGTHQFGYDTTDINPIDSRGIYDRCTTLLPELKSSRILWEWAGLRPYRHVARVEAERVGKLKVVHNYGHGGSGLTTGPGTSKYAVKQLQQIMLSNSKL